MKKFAKLSLVAAVAVAGLSTSASAVALEEAIKGVDISGYVRYRMDITKDNQATSNEHDSETNEYKISLGAKIPVNDNLKAKVALSVKGTTGNSDDVDSINDPADEEANTAAKPGVSVKCANFTYTAGKNSLTVGQMGIKTPVSGADMYGTGALALAPVGPVTMAAAYFTNSDSSDYDGAVTDMNAKDIMAVAAIGSFGSVNAQAWYFQVEDVLDSLVFTQLDGKFGPVNAKLQYITGETTDNIDVPTVSGLESQDQQLTAIELSADVANVALSAGYMTTGDENAIVALEDDASVIDAGEQSNVEGAGAGNTDSMFLTAGTSFGNVSVGAEYVSRSQEVAGANDKDTTETVLRAAYKMSKNFNISTFYSMMETEQGSTTLVDTDQARLELKYSF